MTVSLSLTILNEVFEKFLPNVGWNEILDWCVVRLRVDMCRRRLNIIDERCRKMGKKATAMRP